MIAHRLCSPSRDGQELLPHLVEKIITASIPGEAVRKQRFPHGDEIYLHGPDGILAVDDAVKHQYVPSGLSLWEMGTSMDPKSKADDDFSNAEEKLAKAFPNVTPPVTPDKATFVFVTSKPWDSSDWVNKKRCESKWKAIWVLDAVELEKWLEQCPAVMLWFAALCGLPAEGLFDSEQYLSRLGVSFGTTLSPEVAIAGREEKITELRDSMLQSNEVLHICGESVEEAAAFLAACSLKEAEALSKKPPVVLADSQANLNLLATFGTEVTIAPLDSEALAKAKGITEPKWRLVIPEIADTRDLLDPEHPEAASRWLSTMDVYSELAEAAPEVFLHCLDGILQQDPAMFFQDRDETDTFFGPTSAHVYLLWALERLAWQTEHFPRVLSMLARLAETDPGGKTGNRPRDSLITILLPWSPQHGESMEKAAKALDMLYRGAPSVAWDVGASLLPTMHSTSMPTQTPTYRPYGGKRKVTVKEYWEFIRAVVGKLIVWADSNPTRLARLIEAYPELRKGWPEVGDLVTGAIEKTDTSKLADDDRAIVYETLRSLIAHHRGYEEADWTLPASDIEALDDILQRFVPSDAVLQHKTLFSWHPDVPNAPMRPHEDGWDEWITDKRAETATAIYSQTGMTGMTRLAEVVELPETVGQAAASLDLSTDKVAHLLQMTLSRDPGQCASDQLLRLGRGYVWTKYRAGGEDWFHSVCEQPGLVWTPELRANLALAVPPIPILWTRLEEWGDETDQLYWKNVDIRYQCREHWKFILEKWKVVVRPWSSIGLLSDLVDDRGQDQAFETPPTDAVMDVLEQALQADDTVEPNRRRDQMLSYYIERLFLYLDSQNADLNRMAGLEWAWLRILERTKRGAKALHQQVTSSPELLLELLKALYRAEGQEPSDVSDTDKEELAEQAFHLLNGVQSIPGVRSTDTGETVDSDALQSWVLKARELAQDAGRLKVCDIQIGQILSYAPNSPDGTWPCEEVRDLVEEVQSPRMENGLRIGKYNQRGVISRGKGGKKEWDLAEKYRALAEKVRAGWPRTAAVLDSLAKGYEDEARDWDEQAKWDEYE